jgi:hypothetical protein
MPEWVPKSRITAADLQTIIEHQDAHLPNIDYGNRMFGLARMVILHFFASHCDDKPAASLQVGALDSSEFYRLEANPHPGRIVQLANSFLALQDVKGFDDYFRYFRDTPGGKWEQLHRELQVGTVLRAAGVVDEIVDPRQVRGSSFDFWLSVDGRRMPCEVKTKLPDTPTTWSTVENSLHDARKQCPKGVPSVVVVTVPHAWSSHLDSLNMNLLVYAHNLATRGSRVIGLVLLFEDASDVMITSGVGFYEATRDPELLATFRSLGRSLTALSAPRLRVQAFL